MTEEQAKTKACCGPPAIANAALLAAPHLQAQPLDGANLGMCIASACMAWRWVKIDYSRAKIEAIRAHRERHDTTLIEARDAVEASWVDQPTDGYCGLAGQPS